MGAYEYRCNYYIPAAELKIGKKIFFTDLYICTGHKYDILLGLPFLKKYLPVTILDNSLILNHQGNMIEVPRLNYASIQDKEDILDKDMFQAIEEPENPEENELDSLINLYQENDASIKHHFETKEKKQKKKWKQKQVCTHYNIVFLIEHIPSESDILDKPTHCMALVPIVRFVPPLDDIWAYRFLLAKAGCGVLNLPESGFRLKPT